MENKSKDFNIYYLNFTKIYEIAMMIDNVIRTKVQREKSNTLEEEYNLSASLSVTGTKHFLSGIKSNIASSSKEKTATSAKVIETLDVKTTKSILLRSIISQCKLFDNPKNLTEGDLLKVNNVKLSILDEDSLRQFLLLRRDALKGYKLEGIELNNLVSSMLQDYAYILKGEVYDQTYKSKITEVIIKIPLEIESEFESKYCINDLCIGHVSVIGIYKGVVKEKIITSNTFTYLQEQGLTGNKSNLKEPKIISSSTPTDIPKEEKKDTEYRFIDLLAVVQDVSFNINNKVSLKLHWWNKLGIWLCNLRRS